MDATEAKRRLKIKAALDYHAQKITFHELIGEVIRIRCLTKKDALTEATNYEPTGLLI